MPPSEVPETMTAAALDAFGGPDQLRTQSVPVPEVGEGEVLLRVHTAGIGVWDDAEREGHLVGMMDHEPSFPYVPGSDASGTVAAVGPGVDHVAEGDEVYALTWLNPKGGFYAEYGVTEASHVAPVPDGLSLEEAGALGVSAVTALLGLRDALELAEGDALLIVGAGGGVGHVALQFAKRIGARVLAVASGDDGVALARELGADAVVEGHAGDVAGAVRQFAPDGLDGALLFAHPDGLDPVLGAVREGGRVAWPQGVDPVESLPDGVEGRPFTYDPDETARTLADAGRLIEGEGPVPFRVHVARAFPLAEAAAAHRELGGHFAGKLVLSVSA